MHWSDKAGGGGGVHGVSVQLICSHSSLAVCDVGEKPDSEGPIWMSFKREHCFHRLLEWMQRSACTNVLTGCFYRVSCYPRDHSAARILDSCFKRAVPHNKQVNPELHSALCRCCSTDRQAQQQLTT